jgi:hypothetical protein
VNSDSDYARGDIGDRALVAAFGDRQTAHDAAKTLRDDGFHKVWIGVTRGDETVAADDDSVAAKLGRFFRGESNDHTLTDTLIARGVSASEAQRLGSRIVPSDVILTVDGSNHPEMAAQIIEDCGGDVLSGESFVYTQIDWAPSDEMLGSQLLGYEDPNLFARGQRVDDESISRLRSERMQITTVPTLGEDYFIASYEDDDEPELFDDEAEQPAAKER